MDKKWQQAYPLQHVADRSSYYYHKLPHYYEQIPSRLQDASSGSRRYYYQYRGPVLQSLTVLVAPIAATRLRRLVTSCVICLFILTAVLNVLRQHRAAIYVANHNPIEVTPYVPDPPEDKHFNWEYFELLSGYFNGVKTLVPFSDWKPENGYNVTAPTPLITKQEAKTLHDGPTMDPIIFDPYAYLSSAEYLRDHHAVETCYLDAADSVPARDITAYPGLPQNMSAPQLGSYELLGLDPTVCFDRYGRYAAYGYGYTEADGGLGPGLHTEQAGVDVVYNKLGYVDYKSVDWNLAQQNCYKRNQKRFEQSPENEAVPRHAFLLRTWTGYGWASHQIYSIRAMINELSLKSGGQYDVHFLLHVKNDSLPFRTNATLYKEIIAQNMPEEFRGITTLWSEAQMLDLYPGDYGETFENPSRSQLHRVYRSAHYAVQWFSQEHQEYDFFWNWEVDLRLTGHYFEFYDRIGDWAKQQPRKGMWERSSHFYVEKKHGPWDQFKEAVASDIKNTGKVPVWGPVDQFQNSGMLPAPEYNKPPRSYDEDNYEWGVGEEADLITFMPLFDPAQTNWIFRDDVAGYNLGLPVPPRRTAIIGITRMSRRLLDIMHRESSVMKHHMFFEMWAPSMSLHHGMKAVFAPHPIYYDRDWDVDTLEQTLNWPKLVEESPFGSGEHNWLGSSFYFNSHFAGALWRRWLGVKERFRGGRTWEEQGTGRMCLRSTLLHPIKYEHGELD